MPKSDSLRRVVARRICFGLQSTGVLALCTRLRQQPGAIILMYHSIADQHYDVWVDPNNHVSPDCFERQIRFLATKRRVVSLTEVIQTLCDGESCSPGTVVITFDDGYLDNLTVAAPLLARYGLPATLFLPTGQIDRGETQWIDEIYSAFRFRSCNQLSGPRRVCEYYDLADPVQCKTAYRAYCDSLLTCDYAARRKLLDAAHSQLMPSRMPSRLTMTWNDVVELQATYPQFEIGGHTVNHTDMSRLTADQALRELTACRDRIQQMIGVSPNHFSFPYGRTSQMLGRLVEESGFESACGGGRDPLVCSGTDRFILPRIEAPTSLRRFAFLTSSANSGLLHRISR
jgi:peptidoglycan/xylan/chitin deacetylase (PgdA/CDA1 family)